MVIAIVVLAAGVAHADDSVDPILAPLRELRWELGGGASAGGIRGNGGLGVYLKAGVRTHDLGLALDYRRLSAVGIVHRFSLLARYTFASCCDEGYADWKADVYERMQGFVEASAGLEIVELDSETTPPSMMGGELYRPDLALGVGVVLGGRTRHDRSYHFGPRVDLVFSQLPSGPDVLRGAGFMATFVGEYGN